MKQTFSKIDVSLFIRPIYYSLQHGLNVMQVFFTSQWVIFTCHSFQIYWFKKWYICNYVLQSWITHVSCPDRQNKTIHMHLLLLLVVSIIFGFCMIRNAELQSCLLTPFKGVIIIVVMKIYRMLWMIFSLTSAGYRIGCGSTECNYN